MRLPSSGNVSESEMEDAEESHVVLPQQMPGRGNEKAHQSAVRLSEVICAILIQMIHFLHESAHTSSWVLV
jgi:hypothetical protein